MRGIDWETEELLGSVAGNRINDPGPNTDRCNYPHSVECCHFSSSSTSSSLPFSLFCLFPPVWWANQLREQWGSLRLTTSVDINCAFARCFGSGEQLLGDLVADVTEDSCNETLIPWQLLCIGPELSLPLSLSSSCVTLSTMTSFLHLSVSFTMMICCCPSVLLPHSVGVL